MFKNSLKEKLNKGLNVFGPFCKILDPAVVEIAGLAGFDFVIIDMEHGPFSSESLQNMIRASELRGITPVVRVPENRESVILKALDSGAHAIQIPQVSDEKAALYAVKAIKYFPEGERGVCRYVRAADFSRTEKALYFKTANQEVLTIVHIEGLRGIENLEQILDTEGIDVIFLGPYDLSQSCGIPGQVNHPKVQEKMKYAVKVAKAKQKYIGTFVEEIPDAKKWTDLGVQYISFSVDVGILFQAYSNICKSIKSI